MLNLISLERIPLPLRSRAVTFMPKILKPTLNFMPYALQKTILLSALHSVFKEALEDGDFEFLQDKWLRITVSDLNFNLAVSFDQNKLIMPVNKQHIIDDVSFTATSEDLLLIAGRKEDPDTLFFQRRLKIEGDTELGLEVKNLIDALDIDQLPSMVHRIVDTCATLIQQSKSDER